MVLLLSCSTTKTQDKLIMEYVHKNFKDMDKKKENCVFIIGSNGCLSFNKCNFNLYLKISGISFITYA